MSDGIQELIRQAKMAVELTPEAQTKSLEKPTCYLCGKTEDQVELHPLRGHAHRWLCDDCSHGVADE